MRLAAPESNYRLAAWDLAHSRRPKAFLILSVLAAGRLQDARGFPRHAGHVSGTSRCHNQFNERMKYSTLRPSLKMRWNGAGLDDAMTGNLVERVDGLGARR